MKTRREMAAPPLLYHDRGTDVTAAIVAVVLPPATGAILAPAYAHAPWRTMVLMLG
jgi:hypothetical protein